MSEMTSYFDFLEESIASYAQLLGDALLHQGEKGRSREAILGDVLRQILPGCFSIGSGFIINCLGEISRQQDLVILDNYFNRPIQLAGGVGVYPVESVYATLEVKSRLDGDSIKSTAVSIEKI